MNIIDSVEIDGFWGVRKLKISFNSDLNFIIGHNGSGKTTAINMMAAAIRGDITHLYAANFDKITIKLKTVGKNVKPVVEVSKKTDRLMGSLNISYVIKENSKDKGVTFGVESPLEGRIYRDQGGVRRVQLLEEGGRLDVILKKITETSWLSIHRASDEAVKAYPRSEVFESPIDQKLKQISRAFANYFSLLSAKAEAEVKNFQEQTFLSMLQGDQRSALAVMAEIKQQGADKEHLLGVLRELGVARNKASRTVDTFYRSVESVRKKFAESNAINVNDAITLGDSQRVKAMVLRWSQLNDARASIFSPRSNFVTTINSLFSGKDISFDERNIPKIKLPSGDEVDVNTLSSGEKQLFILLGEALLQENRHVVFISDEPELSLHVKWQSTLFENIRSINPNCQVITATHSPDIIGPFKNKIIKIEECFVQ